MSINFSEDPHRRLNILTGEWVLVSPHRMKRPWQGKEEHPPSSERPIFDPGCYLCPGNTRASGDVNPSYQDVFSFRNDFGALLSETQAGKFESGLLQARGERGICKVICFSPDHSLTLPDMEVKSIYKVVELWIKEYAELGQLDFVNHVQIFENKGSIMGCSNPHPHGQIWAQSSIPEEAEKKSTQMRRYWEESGLSLLQDYLQQELELEERIITTNRDFVALVPFWAVWPYEAMIIPRRHMKHIGQLSNAKKQSYSAILKDLTMRYDRVFDVSFPYSSGIHQMPTDGAEHPWWHWHMSFYPPLLRSASVKKFMVGYEMFADPQRDITAERVADRLKRIYS